jgi:uroporphyrinogen III methyltransferase/synthase
MSKSIVYLVGAGPGDPGLLTLRGRDLLARADLVVYDYLSVKEHLVHVRPDAELIYVGKKGGDHTLPQDKINELLVERASQAAGRVIVRLKGGDPYVFGRGAEEAEELLEAGVPFEVVPGVTSAVAGPAYAGIPLTHRSFASSVSFITGHEDPTKTESAHNWDALAKGTSTLVFFMGVKNLPHIAGNLIDHGMDPATPAAIVRWGTTCRQRSLVSTIADLPDAAKAAGFAAPSLIVVGHVCSLKDTLDWFERRPLLGKGIVVTRAREQASGLLDILRENGACCHEFPTIAIRPIEDLQPVRDAIANLQAYDWLVFTSVNGVKHFFAILDAAGRDARSLASAKIAAIGPATAEALTERGIRADFVPDKYVAEHVVSGLLDLGVQGANVLIPRARVAREVLPTELAAAGAQVEVLPIYETTLGENDPQEILNAMEAGEIDVVTFTSSSTVENFFALIPAETVKQHAERISFACIGPVTAETLAGFGFTADIMPEDYTIDGLVAELLKTFGAPA